MAAWATTADVASLTGANVSPSVLATAQAIIELTCGRDPTLDETVIAPRDLELLRKAVAFQARYLDGNDDALERQVAAAQSFGRMTTQQPSQALEESIVLAPLAVMAMRKLSWLRPRSVRVKARWESETELARHTLDDEEWVPEITPGWRPL